MHEDPRDELPHIHQYTDVSKCQVFIARQEGDHKFYDSVLNSVGAACLLWNPSFREECSLRVHTRTRTCSIARAHIQIRARTH